MPAIVTLDLMPHPDLQVYPARLHCAVCSLLETATEEHHAQRKPFSAGPLAVVDRPARVARWRLGWLADAAPTLAPHSVRFGPHPCPVVRCDIRDVPFAELAAAPPAWSADLEAISPLYFSRNGRDHPLPDPVLMLRSAADRWNAFAPCLLAVPADLVDTLLGTVRLAAMDGRTVATPVTATMQQTGYLGTARLALGRDATPAVATAFAALTRFADIAGLGAQTTHGFGAIRLHRLNTAPPTRTPYRSTPPTPKTPRSSQPHPRSSHPPPTPQQDHL